MFLNFHLTNYIFSKEKNMRKCIALLIVSALVGCAVKPTIWDKPDGTQAEFDRDQRECKYDVLKNTQISDPAMRTLVGQEIDRSLRQANLMTSCMEARGYVARSANDNFIRRTIPQDQESVMRRRMSDD